MLKRAKIGPHNSGHCRQMLYIRRWSCWLGFECFPKLNAGAQYLLKKKVKLETLWVFEKKDEKKMKDENKYNICASIEL